MSVHKDLLRAWVRHEGFSSEEGRVRFAAALERKFGQFAFPDDFDKAIEAFRRDSATTTHHIHERYEGRVTRYGSPCGGANDAIRGEALPRFERLPKARSFVRPSSPVTRFGFVRRMLGHVNRTPIGKQGFVQLSKERELRQSASLASFPSRERRALSVTRRPVEISRLLQSEDDPQAATSSLCFTP